MPTDPATYWDVVIAIMVAFFGLINVLINVLLTPILTAKRESSKFERENLYNHTVSLVNYVSKYTNNDNYDLMDYRNQCMLIHMLFENGESPSPVSEYMNDIFQLFYYRKKGAICWEKEQKAITRDIIRKLRNELSYYIKKGLRVSVIHKFFIHCKTSKKSYTLRWNTMSNILIAELNAQKEIYYVERCKNIITIYFYPYYISVPKLDSEVSRLKSKYSS